MTGTNDSAGARPDQPVGAAVPEWTPRPALAPVVLIGDSVRLEPLTIEHAPALYAATGGAEHEDLWTYIPVPAPMTVEEMGEVVAAAVAVPGWVAFAIVDVATDTVLGRCTLMRPDPPNGVVEVGFIMYGPALQRTRGATEAMWLLLRHVFADLGYRRYEWKCDSRNAPSRAAARRLGFTEEGTFRQHLVVKGRNRDTTWFSITDAEWVRLAPAYARWLAGASAVSQAESLGELTAAALAG